VQTLSRLNRAHPQKHDTFVLDFADNAEAVKAAFQDYYRATIQTGETDANKLHDLKAELDGQQVYSWQQVEDLVALYLSGADRDKLDPILDACVVEYTDKLGEDDQVKFKGKAKAFVRSYGFLAAILSYGHPTWEKLSIFLNFLIPKLPAPKEEDLSKGVLETIDMDSYRVEAKAALKMAMADADATVEPVPPGGGGGKGEADIDKLSATSRPSTTYSATSSGRTRTRSARSSPRRSRREWRRTRLTRMRRRTPTSRTPSWSTIRRSTAWCWSCCPTTPNCSSSSATTPTSSAG